MYCIHTADGIIKRLSRPGSPIILVFWPRGRCPILRGTLQQRCKIHGVGEICDFRQKSPFISEMVRVGLHVLQNVLCRFRGPWKAGHEGQIFQADLLNNTPTIWPRTTKFDRITHMGRGVYFKGVTDAPTAKGLGPSAPPTFGVPFYLCVHPLLQNYQIRCGNVREGRGRGEGSHAFHPKRAEFQRSPMFGFT